MSDILPQLPLFLLQSGSNHGKHFSTGTGLNTVQFGMFSSFPLSGSLNREGKSKSEVECSAAS